jgi:hypothetical protein
VPVISGLTFTTKAAAGQSIFGPGGIFELGNQAE